MGQMKKPGSILTLLTIDLIVVSFSIMEMVEYLDQLLSFSMLPTGMPLIPNAWFSTLSTDWLQNLTSNWETLEYTMHTMLQSTSKIRLMQEDGTLTQNELHILAKVEVPGLQEELDFSSPKTTKAIDLLSRSFKSLRLVTCSL
jgi:hypothetical protein